jgi:hypothetical protein
MLIPTLPSGRKVLLLDLALFLYALLWVLLGVAVANAVSGLTALTDGFEAVGGSIEGAAVPSTASPSRSSTRTPSPAPPARWSARAGR